jgi:hypothetical protein
MRDPLSFLAGLAAGALAMYYLDGRAGARRRALVRDKLVAAGHEACDLAEAKGRRAIGKLRGIAATRHLDRQTRSIPNSDEQLHERIRSRLGRLVTYPKSVEVHVEHGHVRMKGHVLTAEEPGLTREVGHMAGVRSVHSELVCHERARSIADLEGRARQPRHEEASPQLASPRS